MVVPVELSFLAATEGLQMEMEFNFNVILGLLSGSVISEPEVSSFELRLLRIPVIRRRQREEDREKEEEPRERRPIRESLGLIRKLYDPSMGLLRAVLRNTKVRELDLSVEAGLPDPALTGVMSGAVHPMWMVIQPLTPYATFAFTPVFTGEVFKTSLKGGLSLRIAAIVLPLLRLFTKKEFRILRRQ